MLGSIPVINWIKDPVKDIVDQYQPDSAALTCKPRCGVFGQCELECSPYCGVETSPLPI